MHTRYPFTFIVKIPEYPFTFIVKIPEKWLSSNCKKVTIINLRIISKPHAYLQSMVTTSVKFQENRNKTVGGLRTQGTHYLFNLSRIKKGNNSHRMGPLNLPEIKNTGPLNFHIQTSYQISRSQL